MRTEQGKRARKGGSEFLRARKGEGSWLLAKRNSGGQSIGLAGVTGVKGHTILKASGYRATTGTLSPVGIPLSLWDTGRAFTFIGRTELHRQELYTQLHSLWGAGNVQNGHLRHFMFPEKNEDTGGRKWEEMDHRSSMVSNGLQQDMKAILQAVVFWMGCHVHRSPVSSASSAA